jgi:hypothetical protein
VTSGVEGSVSIVLNKEDPEVAWIIEVFADVGTFVAFLSPANINQ